MLIPGYLGSDNSMAVMARWLRRSGYRPRHSGIGVNTACAESVAGKLERRLETLVERDGRRVAIVGHSRGGHFARVLGVRRPDLVAGIVTLAAPPLNPDAIHPIVRATAIGLTALGSLGAPGMMRWSCFIGACCEDFRSDLYAPFPEDVGFRALFSRTDGIVDWHLLYERATKPVAVDASHLGIVVNPEAYRELAGALGELEP